MGQPYEPATTPHDQQEEGAMTDIELTPELERPGYLLGWELKEEFMKEKVVITDTNPQHIPGFHREHCAYFTRGVRPEATAPPVVAELAFEAERERNRKGGPRTAYFDQRCMVRRVTS